MPQVAERSVVLKAPKPTVRDAEPTPNHVAAESLEQAKGDVVRATDIMVERVTEDSRLYRAIVDPLLRTACYELVALVCRRNRRTIWDTKQPTSEAERQSIIALGRGTLASLLDFPLPGGLRLADASRDDVYEAAEFYQHQSTDMQAKATWLVLIAKRVPAKKKVKDIFDDSGLAKLQQEALNG